MLKSLKFNCQFKRWPWEGNNEKIKMVAKIIQYHLSFTTKKKEPNHSHFCRKKTENKDGRQLTVSKEIVELHGAVIDIADLNQTSVQV